MKEKNVPSNISEDVGESHQQKSIPFSRSAGVTFISSIVSLVLGMLTSIITARILGPTLKGNVDLLNATIGLGVTVFGFSLASGVTYWVAKNEFDLHKLAGHLFIIAILQGCLVWLALFAIDLTPWNDAFVPTIYRQGGLVLVAVSVFAILSYSYWRAILAGMQRFITNAILDVFNRLFTMISAVIALLWAGNNGELAALAVIVGSTITAVIFAVGVFPFVFRMMKKGTKSDPFWDIWKSSRPFYLGNLVQFLNYRLDIFLIVYFIGIQTLAHYTVAVSIAQLLWLPSLTLQSVLFPRLTHMQNEEQRSIETAQVARLTFVLTLIMGGGLALAGPWGIGLLYGSKFSSSISLLLLLLPGVVALGGANILSAYFTAVGQQSLNLTASLVGIIFTVLGNIVLLPSLGVAGASISSTISYLVTTLILIYFFCRRTKFSIAKVIILNTEDVAKVVSLVPRRFLFLKV